MSLLKETLSQQLTNTQVPSLGAAVVLNGQLAELEVVSVRKQGEATLVQKGDKYHLGLCSLTMTATLAARLVTKGKLSWDTNVPEVFKPLPVHADFQTVTLEHLLNRHADLLPPIDENLWQHLGHQSAAEQRRALVENVLKRPFIHASEYRYSTADSNYLLAAVMLETICQEDFETLLSRELFVPLGMSSAGYGLPTKTTALDQPFGHNPEPVDPLLYSDEPIALSPTGNIHCSLEDWAKFAILHLTQEPAEFIAPLDLKRLHGTPGNAALPMGWTLNQGHAKAGRALWATTMNPLFFATISLYPDLGTALMLVSNIGGSVGDEAGMTAMFKLERLYL